MTSPWPPPAPDAAPVAIPAPSGASDWSQPYTAATPPYAAAPPYAATPPYAAAPQYDLPPPPSRPDYGFRRDLGMAALLVVVIAIAGVGAGLVWHAVSARPQIVARGDGSFGLPADTDKNYFGAEAAFFAVTAVAGLLSGLLSWLAGRRRGPAVAVGLALGSVAAGLIARAVGQARPANSVVARACARHGSKGFDSFCSVYDGHLQLRILGLTLTWAITALALFLTLTGSTDRRSQPSALVPPEGWPVS